MLMLLVPAADIAIDEEETTSVQIVAAYLPIRLDSDHFTLCSQLLNLQLR
jgi:hypothetical protein